MQRAGKGASEPGGLSGAPRPEEKETLSGIFEEAVTCFHIETHFGTERPSVRRREPPGASQNRSSPHPPAAREADARRVFGGGIMG
jgi:hypothetical protein